MALDSTNGITPQAKWLLDGELTFEGIDDYEDTIGFGANDARAKN